MVDTRKVQRIGNSKGVSLPKEWLKALEIKIGHRLIPSYSEDFKEIRFRKLE